MFYYICLICYFFLSTYAQIQGLPAPIAMQPGQGGPLVQSVGQAMAPSFATTASAPVVAKVTEICTRTQCYQGIASAVDKVVDGHVNSYGTYMANSIGVKMNEMAGPMVVAAINAPKVITHVANGDVGKAIGTVADATLKYTIGTHAMTTCTSVALMTPAAPVAYGIGLLCSIGSTLAINAMYSV